MLLAENMLSGGSQTLGMIILVGTAVLGILAKLVLYDEKIRGSVVNRVKDRVNGFKPRR